MNNVDYEQVAAVVLAKCASKDLWFPNPSRAVVVGWAEVFAESRLTAEELVDGVIRAYEKEEQGYRPLPASIVSHARAAYFDALRELPEDRRKLMDQANYVLQDMGFAPPVAHRWARRVALGKTPNVALNEGQLEEFRRRMAEREALEAMPPRPIDIGHIVRSIDDPGSEADATADDDTAGGVA